MTSLERGRVQPPARSRPWCPPSNSWRRMEKKVAEMEKSRRETEEPSRVANMCGASLPYAVIAAWLLRRAADEPQALLWTFAHLLCVYLFLWIVTLSETLTISTVFFRISYVVLLSSAAVDLIGSVNGLVLLYSGMIHAAVMLGSAAAEYSQRVGIEQRAEENGITFSNYFIGVSIWIGVLLFFTVAKTFGLLCIWFGLMVLSGSMSYAVAFYARYQPILSRQTGTLQLESVKSQSTATMEDNGSNTCTDGGPLKDSSVVAASVEGGLTTKEKDISFLLGLDRCPSGIEEMLSGQGQSSEVGSEMVRVVQPAGVAEEANTFSVEVEHMLPFGPCSALDAVAEAAMEMTTPAILPRAPTKRKKSSPSAAPHRSRRLVVPAKAQQLIMEKLVIVIEPRDALRPPN